VTTNKFKLEHDEIRKNIRSRAPIVVSDADAEVALFTYKKTRAYYHAALVLLAPIKDDLAKYDGKGLLENSYTVAGDVLTDWFIGEFFDPLGLYGTGKAEKERKCWEEIAPVVEVFDLESFTKCIEEGKDLFPVKGQGVVAKAEQTFDSLNPS